jgi:hypothetical protein
MTDRRIGRREVIARLRWLADQPGFIVHREWLFHAAHLMNRDAETIFVGFSPQSSPEISQERHGDETI